MAEELAYKKTMINVPCDCGHGIFSIEVFDWDDDWDAYFLYYEQAFSSNQTSFWSIIKDRAKFAWFAIRGKKYRLFDILVTRENLEKLRDELNRLLETE